MGIIAALKKRCKYLYLKDALSFYDLDSELKELKKQAGSRLRRGAAGVEYGHPTHLLDAANYVKASWDAITAQTIMNCFKKAEIMRFDEPEIEIIPDILELVQGMSNVTLSAEELDEYIQIDNEDSGVFVQVVLDDFDDLGSLDINQLPEDEGEQEEVVVFGRERMEQDQEVQFEGFISLYKKFIPLKEEICLADLGSLDAQDDDSD